MKKYSFFGKIDFSDGKVDITDPCYDKDVWCRMNDVAIEPGIYECYARLSDEGDWGIRVAAIAITKDLRFIQRVDGITPVHKYIGKIGVDAGLAGFFESKIDFSDQEWKDFCRLLSASEKECDEEGFKHVFYSPGKEFLTKGFFSSSGLGDGGYPVYAHVSENDCPDALIIEFL